jgi:hypothetical protein
MTLSIEQKQFWLPVQKRFVKLATFRLDGGRLISIIGTLV